MTATLHVQLVLSLAGNARKATWIINGIQWDEKEISPGSREEKLLPQLLGRFRDVRTRKQDQADSKGVTDDEDDPTTVLGIGKFLAEAVVGKRKAQLQLWRELGLHNEGDGPLVTFEVSASGSQDLWTVPWELLMLATDNGDRGNSDFMVANPRVRAVRVLEPSDAADPEEALTGSALRIFVVSGPAEVEDLNAGVDETHARLRNTLNDPKAFNVLARLDKPTGTGLGLEVEAVKPIDLLVFRGHGRPDGLALGEETPGTPSWVASDEIVEALKGKVNAAVLLACETASGDYLNLALKLAHAGIHTVAFQSPVPAPRADTFLRGLAEAIRDGGTLPEAVAAGRSALRDKSDWLGSFARPTLWQPTSAPLRLRPSPVATPPATPPPPPVSDPTRRARALLRSSDGGLRAPSSEWELELVHPPDVSGKSVLVSPDGRIIARQHKDTLEYAWVNRIRGEIHSRPDAIPLAALRKGEILAVSRAGSRGLSFLWTDGSATLLCHTAATGELRQFATWPRPAKLAIVDGSRVLLTRRSGDETSCPAFPGLNVQTLQAASSGGRTVVLAVGRTADGTEAAWVQVDGLELLKFDHDDVSTVLPRSGRQPPELRAADSQIDLNDLERARGRAFAAWIDLTGDAMRQHA